MSADPSGWKPIGTAPCDKYVLVLRSSGMMGISHECLTAYYCIAKQRWNDISNDSLRDSGSPPTHWRPLPPLPM
ncbi:hypothetical protein UFOVP785_6 [uncultured Caudovirales phage]|uniref:DUF551 domain-containing protein n=1 Tax=uncultured Caudovirales phage TaxID=2100421 RepID=A0A6J5P3C0_9CAUD|nr:hypothetical protein UFOVP785_6 [uncultured Caudovirales phage]